MKLNIPDFLPKTDTEGKECTENPYIIELNSIKIKIKL
jgi:hypothetical protein